MTGVSVRFDDATGRLQLDHAAFAALGACAGPVPEGGPERDANRSKALSMLRAAGVLVGNGPEVHPLVAPALRAIAGPARRLLLRLVGGPGHEAGAAAWIDGEVAALLVDRAGFAALAPEQARGESSWDGPPYDLLTVHPSFLPAIVARLIGLGGRLVDDHRSTDQEATIRVWSGSTRAEERVLRVRGTGMGWRVDGPEAAPPARVATSTQVWAALSDLLAP